MASIKIDGDFGYVIGVVILGWFFLQYLAFQVMKARKTYEVKVNNLTLKDLTAGAYILPLFPHEKQRVLKYIHYQKFN